MTKLPLVNAIVPVTPGAKVIVSPGAAAAIARRRDPGPESFVFVTTPAFAGTEKAAQAKARKAKTIFEQERERTDR
jgi:hypothetical protein